MQDKEGILLIAHNHWKAARLVHGKNHLRRLFFILILG
jgi:16S rRNA U516 pseudouridylate synthase RsuA-like enzyme